MLRYIYWQNVSLSPGICKAVSDEIAIIGLLPVLNEVIMAKMKLRGGFGENFNQRTLWSDHYDGTSLPLW